MDGDEFVSTDVQPARKRGRPARKQVEAVEEAPRSPKASTSKNPNAPQQVLPSRKKLGVASKTTSATDTYSSSVHPVEASHSVNGDVQQDSDIEKEKVVDSNNNNASVPPLLYIQHDGQLVPLDMPEIPPNLGDVGAIGEEVLLMLLYNYSPVT